MARPRLARVEVWMQTKDAGAPLMRARKRARLTQRELAYLARCSQTTIYLLETGRMTTCSDDLALRIVQRLPVDMEDVFVARAAPAVAAVTTGHRVSGDAA